MNKELTNTLYPPSDTFRDRIDTVTYSEKGERWEMANVGQQVGRWSVLRSKRFFCNLSHYEIPAHIPNRLYGRLSFDGPITGPEQRSGGGDGE